jgi:transposase
VQNSNLRYAICKGERQMARRICSDTETAIKLWRSDPSLSYKAIAKASGVHYTTVMRTINRIKKEKAEGLDKKTALSR